jgi:mannose-6-phosphate isomerase-like protein (cupin superfamily)
MIHAGDTIENPVTGERIVFNKTSRETGGEAVEIEVYVRPGGVVAAAHVHPFQSERFEVVSGRLGMKLGQRKLEADPNDTVVVEPGTPHKFWNAGDEELHFVAVVTPALQFERLLETMFGLAVDGKTNRKGMPNPLRLAVIAQAHFDDVRLPFPLAWMQRAGLALGAPLGRLAGYEPTYVAAGTPAAALA